MRLIDADKLIRQVATICVDNNSIPNKATLLVDWINRQPTAYDVDKVAEQLIAKIQGPIDDYGNGYNAAITETIEIVGTGGDTVGETHTGTIHRPAGGRTGLKLPDPAGGRPAGEDGRKGVRSI